MTWSDIIDTHRLYLKIFLIYTESRSFFPWGHLIFIEVTRTTHSDCIGRIHKLSLSRDFASRLDTIIWVDTGSAMRLLSANGNLRATAPF